MELLKILMKLAGIVLVLLGVVFTLMGAYGLTGEEITINGSLVSSQEGGIIFSTVGIIALLGGIAITLLGFKPTRLVIFSMAMGSCSLVIPAILFGTGYDIVAGLVGLVFGYLFLAMFLFWLSKG